MPSIILKPGDVFCTRGHTKWSRYIRNLTTDPTEKTSKVNHCGIMASEGTFRAAMAVEASVRVKKHTLYDEYAGERDAVAIARPKVSDAVRCRLAIAADKMVGGDYGWFELPLHAIDHFASHMAGRDVLFARRLAEQKHSVICSGLVGKIYFDICGWKFCNQVPKACQPDDVWDDWFDPVRGHPDRWEIIYTLKRIPKED